MSDANTLGTTGVCYKCGCTGKEWLIFSSRYKSTKIWLCRECFDLFRQTFVDLTKPKEEQCDTQD